MAGSRDALATIILAPAPVALWRIVRPRAPQRNLAAVGHHALQGHGEVGHRAEDRGIDELFDVSRRCSVQPDAHPRPVSWSSASTQSLAFAACAADGVTESPSG